MSEGLALNQRAIVESIMKMYKMNSNEYDWEFVVDRKTREVKELKILKKEKEEDED